MAKKKRTATSISKPRGYTDEDYIRVIALYGLYNNMSQVSRETGFPLATIQRWIRADHERKDSIKYFDQRLKTTQDRLMRSMGLVADEALQQVHQKLPEASAAQAATIYGILFDKQQIIAGNTGQSNFNFNLDLSSFSADDAATLMRRVLDRQDDRPIPADAVELEPVAPDGNGNDNTENKEGKEEG